MKKISEIAFTFLEEVENFKKKYPILSPYFNYIDTYNPEDYMNSGTSMHIHSRMRFVYKKFGTFLYKANRKARKEYYELYDKFINEINSNKYHIKKEEVINIPVRIIFDKSDNIDMIYDKLNKGGYMDTIYLRKQMLHDGLFISDSINQGRLQIYHTTYTRCPYINIPYKNILSIEIPTLKERAHWIGNFFT